MSIYCCFKLLSFEVICYTEIGKYSNMLFCFVFYFFTGGTVICAELAHIEEDAEEWALVDCEHSAVLGSGGGTPHPGLYAFPLPASGSNPLFN